MSVRCSAINVPGPPNSDRKHCWKGREVNLLPCVTTFHLDPSFGSPEVLPTYRSHWWNGHLFLPVSGERERGQRIHWKPGSKGSVGNPQLQEYSFPPQWIPLCSEPLSCHSSCSKYHLIIVEGRIAMRGAIKAQVQRRAGVCAPRTWKRLVTSETVHITSTSWSSWLFYTVK